MDFFAFSSNNFTYSIGENSKIIISGIVRHPIISKII